ncbi:hypothetical protein DPMN_066091 [Dreissena polymorpha]|uniref:Uncharacterized protein n=1 Tax=Dreissena polymorpha TaxID=45954 RepID=A0A9D3YSU7_DREPO|nr:hypothetical protein DPMN_066091 [Dreissena polymorpha]
MTSVNKVKAPPPGSQFFQTTGIIFELFQDIIGMNHRPINVASRVLTRFYFWVDFIVVCQYANFNICTLTLTPTPGRAKNAPPLGSHVFQANIIIFQLIQDIIETHLLTKFHEDWTIHMASREKCPAPGGHVFKVTKTIFKLIQDIIGTNLLTKCHDDRKLNMTSRVFTRKNAPPQWWPYIIGMNLLTEFHEDRPINVASRVLTRFYYSHIRKNAPPLGSHVFQANVTIFEHIQDIIQTNLLTIFHEDWTIYVASRVLTRKNAPPPGGHVFQPTGIIFELFQDIIGMNLLTKFHADWTINVAARELTRQMLTAHDARRTKSDHKSSP